MKISLAILGLYLIILLKCVSVEIDGLGGIVNCDNTQEKVYIDSCYCMLVPV